MTYQLPKNYKTKLLQSMMKKSMEYELGWITIVQ